MAGWPKDILEWHKDVTGYLSVPFTWLLPKARARVQQRDWLVRHWVVGGPAVRLMPDYWLGDAEVRADIPSVLQRVNPLATRTSTGCIRTCGFCGVRRIEGEFAELSDWPDLPILCDSNLLATSEGHFARVIERLRRHGWADFNQGLDARLLTNFHANLIASIPKPIVRLALDNDRDRQPWADAVERLRTAGVPKSAIRSLVLCGFGGGPDEDRERCEYVESFGIKASPMWYHRLDSLQCNTVTEQQRSMGWTHRKRRALMCWYYQHRTLAVRG
jgi:hypothetical protein